VLRDAHTGKFVKRVTRGAFRYRATRGLSALALLFTTPSQANEAGLVIETGSPDALCPELASTRAAVARRLGAVSVPGGSFLARYTIGHAPVGSPRDFVRLELFGPEGTLRLTRDLPLEGESCSTMAEVIALVLDRYFRALLAGEPAPETTVDPVPTENTADPLARPPPSPASSPVATPAASLEPDGDDDVPGRLQLLAFEAAFRSPGQPALGGRAMFELWPNTYVGTALHVGLTSDSQSLTDAGRVSSRDAMWRVYAGWGPRIGPVRTYIGPGLCVGVSRGSGEGLAEANSGLRALSAAGLDLGAVWVTDDRWSFSASGALDLMLAGLSGGFYVDREEVLVPDTLSAWFGMAVGYDF
jgi:hypothetical protein